MEAGGLYGLMALAFFCLGVHGLVKPFVYVFLVLIAFFVY
jgi:hypothetical protein